MTGARGKHVFLSLTAIPYLSVGHYDTPTILKTPGHALVITL